jgi:hypothetical protein
MELMMLEAVARYLVAYLNKDRARFKPFQL